MAISRTISGFSAALEAALVAKAAASGKSASAVAIEALRKDLLPPAPVSQDVAA